MELLKFIFGGFWVFAGVVTLMIVFAVCINSHIAAIQNARTKKKRTIQIMRHPDRTMIWVEHPTDEDVEKLLANIPTVLKAGEAEESGNVEEMEDWEF